VLSSGLIVSCAKFEQATNTKTYIATTEQVSSIKSMLGIQNCPEGTKALALTIQSATGGATVTVRCQ